MLELKFNLPSITQQQVSPHRLPVQAFFNTPLIQQSCVIIMFHC